MHHASSRLIIGHLKAHITWFIWGSTPAIDILSLSTVSKNELNLLFIENEDIRNIVTTVSELNECMEPVNIFINNINTPVAARGFIILYLLLKLKYRAVKLVIAIWYSIRLTVKQRLVLTLELADICSFHKKYNDNKPCEFRFGNATLKCTFGSDRWLFITECLDGRCEELSSKFFSDHQSVLQHKDRKKHHERYMTKLTPKEKDLITKYLSRMAYYYHHIALTNVVI